MIFSDTDSITVTTANTAENVVSDQSSNPLHFDRQNEARELVRQLQSHHFVAVTGKSGSGKSAFANKTLYNILKPSADAKNEAIQGRNGDQWHIVQVTPYDDPLGNLVEQLKKSDALAGKESPSFWLNTETSFREDNSALTKFASKSVQHNLLIIVDQLQELPRYQQFLTGEKAGDDIRFVSTLLHAAQSNKGIYVVVILDTDTVSLEDLSRYPGLPETISSHRFTVPPIGEAEIRIALAPYYKDSFATPADGKAFLDRAIEDFKVLSRADDPFALQKLNLLLWWVKAEWKQAKSKATITDLYHRFGPMRDVVGKFIEEKIFIPLSASDRVRCALLFKALTEKGGKRRPLDVSTLAQLISRQEEDVQALFPTDTDKALEKFALEAQGSKDSKDSIGIRELSEVGIGQIRSLVRHFDVSNEPFLRVVGSGSSVIVDIATDSLLKNWPRLQAWVRAENTHADIYRDLVRNAFNYYATTTVAETDATLPPTSLRSRTKAFLGGFFKDLKDGIVSLWKNRNRKAEATPVSETNVFYEGAQLVSARQWKQHCLPDEHWAERYDSSDPDESLEELRRQFKQPELARKSNLDIALAFLRRSEHHDLHKAAQKQQELDQALRLRRNSLIWAGIASVALIGVLVYRYRTDQIEHKMKLIDFVEFLDYGGALDVPATDHFDRMRSLIEKVREPNIRSLTDVLECLAREGFLQTDPEDETTKEISFTALRCMDNLAEHVKSGNKEAALLEDLNTVYEQALKAGEGTYKQFPQVYYALWVHLKEESRDTLMEQEEKAKIEESALVSNPARRDEFAYGDYNGRVLVQNLEGILRLPNAGAVVQGMGFSRDGHTLYVGTAEGDIYAYDRGKTLPGMSSDSNGLRRKIYTDPASKAVYFIEAWNDPNYLLVSNSEAVYFLRREAPGGAFRLHGNSIKIPLERIGYTDWSSDHHWFFAAGKDRSIIYQLDPLSSDKSSFIRETAHIEHPGISMLDLAIKFEGDKVWLALGSETGGVWIAHTGADLLTGGSMRLDDGLFSALPNAHESSISGLEFNSAYPQMASASYDGTVRLWNLNALDMPYDHIRLRNKRQSIFAITYINPDELVAHEGNTNWVMKTNIKALHEALRCVIEAKKGCKKGY